MLRAATARSTSARIYLRRSGLAKSFRLRFKIWRKPQSCFRSRWTTSPTPFRRFSDFALLQSPPVKGSRSRLGLAPGSATFMADRAAHGAAVTTYPVLANINVSWIVHTIGFLRVSAVIHPAPCNVFPNLRRPENPCLQLGSISQVERRAAAERVLQRAASAKPTAMRNDKAPTILNMQHSITDFDDRILHQLEHSCRAHQRMNFVSRATVIVSSSNGDSIKVQ